MNKTALADAVARKREFPVKRIANTLSVSPSNLYERQKRDSGSCGRRSYHKVKDEGLLPMIRLLLERHVAGSGRVHEDEIITPLSNLRWCSDIFEILC